MAALEPLASPCARLSGAARCPPRTPLQFSHPRIALPAKPSRLRLPVSTVRRSTTASYGGAAAGGPGAPQPPPPSQYRRDFTRTDAYSPGGAAGSPPYVEGESPEEAARRAQASRRVDRTARYFRRLGVIGFWGQLACSLVAAVILAFSVIVTGKPSAPVSTYLTFAGIVAAVVSVFWSFGYLQLADKLRAAAANPTKAPPRAAVVSNLKNGIIINLLGLGATLLGLQATVGVLVAKALTSSAPMYGAMGAPAGFNPVLALDVFLVQASGNTALSHFLGLVLGLELLRSTTQPQTPPDSTLPKQA